MRFSVFSEQWWHFMRDYPLQVLLVEDHPQTRTGLQDYLVDQGMIVREADNTAVALEITITWQPAVVVLDIVIPPNPGGSVDFYRGDGLRAARLIKEHDSKIGIVLLSNHPYFRQEVLDLAAQGYGGLVYLFKGEQPAHELREAIHAARDGRIILDPLVSRNQTIRPGEGSHSLTGQERLFVEQAVKFLPQLTEREFDVVAQVATSRTNAGVAKALHITPNAVQAHLRNVYAKVGLSEPGSILDKRSLLTKAYILYRSQHDTAGAKG
jgi:DNA-binding NarL/FixJ family response regulator